MPEGESLADYSQRVSVILTYPMGLTITGSGVPGKSSRRRNAIKVLTDSYEAKCGGEMKSDSIRSLREYDGKAAYLSIRCKYKDGETGPKREGREQITVRPYQVLYAKILVSDFISVSVRWTMQGDEPVWAKPDFGPATAKALTFLRSVRVCAHGEKLDPKDSCMQPADMEALLARALEKGTFPDKLRKMIRAIDLP